MDSNCDKKEHLLANPLVIFLVTLFIGVQVALLLSYWYVNYKDKIFAGEGIRDTLSYQGKITNSDGVPPPDGLYNMRFLIYDSSTSGTLLWTETWDSTNQGGAGSKVQVTNGVFNVELNSLCENWVGDCSSNGGVTFSQDSFYLQVELDYDGNDAYEEIFTPRKRFTATPYAMNADKVDGVNADELLLLTGGTMTGDLAVPNLVADKVHDNSLVAHYSFSGDAEDSGPYGLDGVLYNSPDVSNNYLDLDGISQYFRFLNAETNHYLSFGNATGDDDGPFSVGAWINIHEAGTLDIVNHMAASNFEWRFWVNSNNNLELRLYDQSASATSIARYYDFDMTSYHNQWIYVAATYDGSESPDGIDLYINGQVVDDTDVTSVTYVGMEQLTSYLFIGRYSIYTEADIDEVMIFAKELDQAEVAQIYQEQKKDVNESSIRIQALDDTDGDSVLDTMEGGNLTWDTVFNRFKFDQSAYVPDMIPYFNNALGDRDYAYLADSKKVLAYDFHESSGDTVYDLEGNASGTIHGLADWTNDGYIGYGMNFIEGSGGNYIEIDNSISSQMSSDKGAIEFWVKLEDLAKSRNDFFRFKSGTTNMIQLFENSTHELKYVLDTNTNIRTLDYTFSDTNWHHIVFMWDTSDSYVYVDGVKRDYAAGDTGTHMTPDASLFDTYELIMNYTNSGLDGKLDSFAMYNDLLTPQEILNHYNAAFSDLYVINNISDGNVKASIDNFWDYSASLNNKDFNDPVYFNTTKNLALSFSEGVGTTTSSNDSNSQSAILNNSLTWAKEGYFGYGLEFDGIDDYLSIADSGDYNDVDTNDFSIEFWLKAGGTDSTIDNSGNYIIDKDNGTDGYSLYFNSSDYLVFSLNGSTGSQTATVTTDYSDGRWHHILLVGDRTNDLAKIFVDGGFFAAASASISGIGSLANSSDLYIGSENGNSNYFVGVIDSFIIYENLVLNFIDEYGRITNSPEFFVVNNRIISSSTESSIAGINQGSDGYGVISAIIDNGLNTNTAGYPLGVWNDFATSDIYNLIYFGTSIITGSSTNFGNLQWDSSNSRFVFDQSLEVQGDLFVTNDINLDYLKTDGNEFLAYDVVRHTVASGETTSFTESWNTATTKKVVNMHAVTVDEDDSNDLMSVDDWTTAGMFDTALSYDGSNITATAQLTSWAIGDIVTIFIVYEK